MIPPIGQGVKPLGTVGRSRPVTKTSFVASRTNNGIICLPGGDGGRRSPAMGPRFIFAVLTLASR